MNHETLEQARASLASRVDIAFAFLFGSAATGRQTTESDTDVAVFLRDGANALQVEAEVSFAQEEEIWRELERIFQTEVDLVILNRAPATVCASALIDGELLVMNDRPLYLRYLLAATRQAEDFRTMLNELIEVRKRSPSLSDPDRARVARIAQYLRDELSDSRLYADVNKERYIRDAHFRRALERWVENLVNASIDVAKIIVGAEGLPLPHTYRETLSSLSAVAPFAPLAETLSRNARTRNALAYEYLDIRYTEVARIAHQASEVYGALADATDRYIEAHA